MNWYATLVDDEGTPKLIFRDCPGLIVRGFDIPNMVEQARKELIKWIAYRAFKRPMPGPSPARKGEILISLPLNVQIKILLIKEMETQLISKARLAELNGLDQKAISRLFDFEYPSKVVNLETVLKSIGIYLNVTTVVLC